MPPQGFVTPDWNAPVDVEAVLARVPDQKVRGFLMAGMLSRLQKMGVTLDAPPVVAFQNYPYRAQLELLLRGARALEPNAVRQGLRRIGQMAFPRAWETLPGRVVFGVLGRDVEAIFKVASKGYEMVGANARITVPEVSQHHAHVVLHEVYAFPDAYHVGVCEGAALACGKKPEVLLKVHSPTSVELWCQWT